MNSSEPSLSFYIDGIRCLGCVGQIQRTLSGLLSEDEFALRVEDKTVEIAGNKADALTRIEKSLKRKGFSLFPSNTEAAEVVQKSAAKVSLKEIGVAGAMAGNIMLFVIPVYAGLVGELRTVFLWISFFLFLPVLFYSARGFFKGAAAALRTGSVNIDLPIAIALILTSLFSLLNLINGSDQIYFDSTASFVFLILSTRYALDKYRRQVLAPLLYGDFFKNERFRIFKNGEWLEIEGSRVQLNDHVRVKAGQVLVFDAENLTENAAFDTAFVDGESVPKTFGKGQRLASGFRSVHDIVVRATSTAGDSRLSRFLKELNYSLMKGSTAVSTADRLSVALITTILILSAGTMISGYFFGWEEMLNRGVALLVIACPCALAFAAPITASGFLKKAIRSRIFLRDPSVLESLAKIRNVFLDKTGTLTTGQLELSNVHPRLISSQDQALILALESKSEHPVAYAFRRAWAQVQNLPDIQNRQEDFGQGVRANLGANRYELKSLSESVAADELVVGFYKNDVLSHRFSFQDRIRSESKDFIDELRRREMQVFIISGDRRDRVRHLAQQLEIPDDHTFSEMFPEEKAEIVESYPDSLMIGDGLNDAIAFAKARVGISVRGSMDLALNSAQVFCAQAGLQPVLQLLDLGDRYRQTMRRNLGLALTYNALGAGLAVTGFVSPLFATIAMPISSSIIFLSSRWGLR